MKFEKGKSGNPKGRPKKVALSLGDDLTALALDNLRAALEAGEQWATAAVIDRILPKAKAITPPDSLDAQLIEAKLKESKEFEERLQALEAAANE